MFHPILLSIIAPFTVLTCWFTYHKGLKYLIAIHIIIAIIILFGWNLLHAIGGTYDGIMSVGGSVFVAFLTNLYTLPFAIASAIVGKNNRKAKTQLTIQ